jgi:tetratricopeptide (TPR) repeat protein
MRPIVPLVLVFLSATGFGQVTNSSTAAADRFKDEALVFERTETVFRMHADGTGERDTHVWVRLQSEAAARQFSVLTFSYAAATESPDITLVRVHKPSGATVDTPAADAVEMTAAVSREAPLYSDLKEKHLPLRSVAAGDTLEYEYRVVITKAEAPGQFWGALHYTTPGSVIVLAEAFTLEAPKDKYVQVWSPNHKPTITEHDGLRSYRWENAQLIPAAKGNDQGDDAPTPPKDPDEDADGRKVPSIAWTTFHSWAEVGDWYRSLALERAQPTDAVRARVAEVTKDAKTPEDQVKAIYNFVSTHTRYVGIDFGIGRYQPHAAAEVMANNYGDCKDKDTLLEAMLRARGFHTAPALIGVNIAPVDAVPTPAVFNHVITTVDMPEGRIWLDSTPEVSPFRWLSAPIRDQLALVVPTSGAAALERTPATPPYPMAAHFEAVGSLDAEGTFTAHVTSSYRTDDEVIVRALARAIAPAEWDKASQYISSNTGFSGTTSHTSFSSPEDLSEPITLKYDYTRKTYGDWADLRIVPCFPAVEFLPLASDKKAPPADIQLGGPRTLTAVCHIHLPDGYHVDLPDPIHVKTSFATLDKTYRFDGKDIVIERTVVILASKLPKTDWQRYQTFTKDIHLDGEPWIQLMQPPAKLTITAQKTPSDKKADPAPADKTPGTDAKPEQASDESVRDQLQSAFKLATGGDTVAAKAILDKIKATNPKALGLWACYGLVAYYQQDFDEAETDYKKEIAEHPENAAGVQLLAATQMHNAEPEAARQTLQGYLGTHPGDLQMSLYLATLQNGSRDYEGARKTLDAAAQANPDNRYVRVQLSTALRHLNRNDEAAAAAKSALDGTDDATILNDAGYELAETGIDLPYAEQASRKSIQTLEAKSVAISPSEVNSNAFAQSQLLIASWDTLGWILFREGNLEQSEPLILAGWRNALSPESGDHLGQLYEATGKKEEALKTYRLAFAAVEANNATPEVIQHIKKSIARLSGSAILGSPYAQKQNLQESRTYHVARPAGVSGWGTFRLQLSTTGVVASQEISGDQKLAPLGEKINAMKFPELVPQGSTAHLLRSAVVSCSTASSCDLVLVPNSSLQTEQ